MEPWTDPVFSQGEAMKMTTSTRHAFTFVLAVLAGGCIPAVNEEAVQVRHPERTSSPAKRDERQEAEPDIETRVDGDIVTVKAEQRTECRSVTRTPMVEERGTKRTLDHGTATQAVNLGSAALLLGGGIALYAAAGSQAEKGNTNAEQIEKDERANKTLGIIVMSTAAVPLGLFLWNVIRAKDEVETVKIEPKEESTSWETCSHKPVAGVPVALSFLGAAGSEEILRGTTDAEGRARLDLSQVRAAHDEAKLTVEIARGARTSEVSLKGTPSRREFERTASLRAAEVRREQDAQWKAQEEARTAEARAGREQVVNLALAIKVKWTHLTVCRNRVDVEVRCDGNAAVTRVDGAVAEIQNASSKTLECEPRLAGFGGSTVPIIGGSVKSTSIPPKKSAKVLAPSGSPIVCRISPTISGVCGDEKHLVLSAKEGADFGPSCDLF